MSYEEYEQQITALRNKFLSEAPLRAGEIARLRLANEHGRVIQVDMYVQAVYVGSSNDSPYGYSLKRMRNGKPARRYVPSDMGAQFEVVEILQHSNG